MTVDFCDYFWGEGQKPTGIDVLFQNVKFGITTSKEMAEYLKERSSVEESHSKALGKLAKIAGNGCPHGSLAPMWQVLKALSDKLENAHSQMVQKIEELVKELLKYADELQKQYKSVKSGETGTLESVQVQQNSKIMVGKAKALYMKHHLEYEKCQKENVPPKEMEKVDLKMKKAQEEYKGWMDKYHISTEEYVLKMTESCQRFQDVEVFYLEKMKEFIDSYATVMESNHETIGQVHAEFRSECANLTVDELLQQYVKQKGTGSARPTIGDLEEALSTMEISQSGSSEDRSSTAGDKEKDKSVSSLPLPLPSVSASTSVPMSASTSTSAAPVVTTTSEKIFEGNLTNDNHSHSSTSNSIGDVRAAAASASSKGSRRTTSLLNLFIPQSQGSKNKGVESPVGTEVGSNVDPLSTTNPTLSRSNNSRGSKWFLRSRRGKKKDKKNKDKDKKDDSLSQSQDGSGEALSHNLGSNNTSTNEQNQSGLTLTAEVSSPKVDAEGFTIRPKDVWEEDKGNFYSDSDTDSDEEPEKRLHVEIKPLTNGTAPLSASVDELRSTVENLKMSSVSRKIILDAEAQMKRSQSVSQQIGNTSPPSRHPYEPLSPPLNPNSNPTNKLPSPSQHQNDVLSRYAELGDIFSEVGEMQPALPPKTSSSRYTPTSIGNTMSIPRPPSRPRPEIPLQPQRNTSSPSPAVSRTDSVTSLETRSIGSHSHIGSRGPSPLTIGIADPIPIAVAFHEIVHAYFKGNDENQCQVKMTGDMMVSFPAGIIQIFANNSSPAQLAFQVKSKQPLENLVSNKNLVKVEKVDDTLNFEFNMSALTILLKTQTEKNPNASYFNVDILKYQIKPKFGATSCPLHLVAFWKCETSQTDLRIDYKYNSHAMELVQSEILSKGPASPSASKINPNPAQLLQVCIAAPVDGGVKSMQSKPSGQWIGNTNRACWKLHTLSPKSENLGVGSLRARFEVSSGPSSNGTIAAQFSCENSTLSGCEFELLGSGYRVSLIKKRFVSGKYVCDAEENSNRYAVPPDYSKPIHL